MDPLHLNGKRTGHIHQAVDLLDILVDQVGDELGLVDEQVAEHPAVDKLTPDGLDPHGLGEARDAQGLCQVHLAHATLGDLADQSIALDVLEDVQVA